MNIQENNSTFFRFEDLRIYAKALDYITWLYGSTNEGLTDFNENTTFLRESLLRSAQAIAFNTAEGSSRNKTQFLYYLKMAKSSVRECVVLTDLACRVKVLSEESREYSRNQLMELTKMIGSLIVSLQKSIHSSKEEIVEDFDNPYSI
ncbi:MAG: four helix bundle protein [Bacteroidales bacterium]|nr:four helix bundle protein [Bacteroidales bacterium]